MNEMSEPKPYEVPAGHLIQLGADVLDGWEGIPTMLAGWVSAEMCRNVYHSSVMVTRRVSEKVPLHEVIGRTLPHGMSCDPNPPIQKVDSDFGGWWWYPDRTTDLRTTLSVVDGLVEVLAEEEA